MEPLILHLQMLWLILEVALAVLDQIYQALFVLVTAAPESLLFVTLNHNKRPLPQQEALR